jgi:hypothetical protein
VTEEELLAVVSNTFRTVWPLELLLLLRREPRQAWLVEALVRDLRASVTAVNESLVVLRRLGVVGVDQQGAYLFAPASADLDQLVRELSDLYTRKPRAIMRAIIAAPNDRVQTFAEAFRLRKPQC